VFSGSIDPRTIRVRRSREVPRREA